MTHAICLLHGHPDPDPAHFCHALSDAYEEGARAAGHTVYRFNLGGLPIEFMRDPKDFLTPAPTPIHAVQEAVLKSDHLVVVYPLWLGTMPAVVKAFFEHFARNEFAIAENGKGWPRKMLKGRSARVIVTMGMPALAYQILFGADGVRGFESGVLGIAGFKPIHETLIGGVGEEGADLTHWLDKARDLGRKGT